MKRLVEVIPFERAKMKIEVTILDEPASTDIELIQGPLDEKSEII